MAAQSNRTKSVPVGSAFGNRPKSDQKNYWKKNADRVPGSIKPVYSAMYPPSEVPFQSQVRPSPSKHRSGPKKGDSFANFASSISDAWEVNEEEISETVHRMNIQDEHRNARVPSADPGSSVPGHSRTNQGGLADAIVPSGGNVKGGLPSQPQQLILGNRSPTHFGHKNTSSSDTNLDAPRPTTPIRHAAMPLPDRKDSRVNKFKELLSDANTSIDELRKYSWSGIPSTLRAPSWKILLGYLPANTERREDTLKRKREEYFGYVDQYYESRHDSLHIDTFRQIHIDIPRTNPIIPMFQQIKVQEIFERLLFIWAIRHPASGYVQGINDLVTPFFFVFLSEFAGDKVENLLKYSVSNMPEDALKEIEADSFWCMSKLLDGIQDNYTFAQPGIQLKINALKELIQRINKKLHDHLTENEVEYLQFAFRWMNNLLMRELPLIGTIRLWDTYMSEPDGFAVFHLYVCAALLQKFASEILAERDFQGIMLFLQNLPTNSWTNDDISLLLAEAYSLMYMFANAPSHLNLQAKR